MSGKPVTLSGAILRPLLPPPDFSNGLPGRFPLAATALVKPLLSHACGQGYIAATVEKQVDNDPAPSPVSRRVVLLVEPTLQQVAETWSDPVTGAYRFDGLSMEARYTVVAYDHLRNWRAVIADGLAAKAVQP